MSKIFVYETTQPELKFVHQQCTYHKNVHGSFHHKPLNENYSRRIPSFFFTDFEIQTNQLWANITFYPLPDAEYAKDIFDNDMHRFELVTEGKSKVNHGIGRIMRIDMVVDDAKYFKYLIRD